MAISSNQSHEKKNNPFRCEVKLTDCYSLNEIEISYKKQTAYKDMLSLKGSEDAYKLLHSVWDQNRIDLVEDFKMLLLNRACKVMGVYHVCSGGTAGVIVDTKLIFVAALKSNAASIILAHNHPSGNLKPSLADVNLTERIRDAGDLLDIKLQDHIVVTNEGYYSFADKLAFEKVKRGNKFYFEALPPF